MGAPEIILIILQASGAGVALARHGKPQVVDSIWATIIAIALSQGLLIWGGFYG